MREKTTKTNQSLERALQIIEAMAQAKAPLRLLDISEKISLSASTVLRFLNTLMVYNYVNQDPETLKYSLSFKFCQIAHLINSQFSIREAVRPYLKELAKRCQESACLAIEDDMSVVYIDVVEGPDSILRTTQRIGKIAPLHCTGVGKLLLLNFNEEKIDILIANKGLQRLTEKTITTKDALIKELEKVRRLDYAIDDEECEIGARCIAAPIRDYTDKIIACISVSGPVTRLNYEKVEYVKSIITQIAAEISEKIGYVNDKSKSRS